MESILSAIFESSNEVVLVAAGIFARVSAVAFLLPGIGERGISMRVRLGGALALTALLTPLISAFAPLSPTTAPGLVQMIAAEAVAGLIIGFSFRQSAT